MPRGEPGGQRNAWCSEDSRRAEKYQADKQNPTGRKISGIQKGNPAGRKVPGGQRRTWRAEGNPAYRNDPVDSPPIYIERQVEVATFNPFQGLTLEGIQ